jgi:iron complex outermembrane recepter protein
VSHGGRTESTKNATDPYLSNANEGVGPILLGLTSIMGVYLMGNPKSATKLLRATGRACLLATTALSIATSVGAKPAAAEDAAATSAGVEEVIVTGTRRADLTALKSASPVQVVGGDALRQDARLGDALDRALASISFPNIYSTGGASSSLSTIRPIGLRGLGPGESLLLVDGKRQQLSALVSTAQQFGLGAQPADLDAIPSSAIGSIEVLLDGASAQYGSDAIGGVLNVRLRAASEGGNLSATAGQFFTGEGLVTGISGWKGMALGRGGFLTVAAETETSNRYNTGGIDTGAFYYPVAGRPDPREATADRDWLLGPATVTSYKASLNSSVPITDKVDAYAFGHYVKKIGKGTGFYVKPNATGDVRGIFPDGFLPITRTAVDDFTMVGGLKFRDDKIGNFDFSASFGRDKVDMNQYNTVNASYGLASPTDFYLGTLVNEQALVRLDYQKDVAVGVFAHPLSFASGVEYRHERYEIRPGELASYADGGVRVLDGPSAGTRAPVGAQGFAGFQPGDSGVTSRDVYGGYIDIEAQPTDQIQVGVAARAEHYSDFGSQATFKESVRWDPTPWLGLRETYSTGFKAPTIGQIGYSSTGINISAAGTFFTRTLPVNSVAARALGAQPLKPETSKNISFGVVLRPIRGASITVDAYQIKIKDRIARSSLFSGNGVVNLLNAAGFFGYQSAAYFANVADTRTRGIDIAANYQFAITSEMDMHLSGSFNATDTTFTKFAPTPAVLSALTTIPLLNGQAAAVIAQSTPDKKAILSADLVAPKWELNVTGIQYGHYRVFNTAFDTTFPIQRVVNIAATYKFRDDLRVKVGADNVFDTHPGLQPSSTFGKIVYPSTAPAGSGGSFWYANLSWDF